MLVKPDIDPAYAPPEDLENAKDYPFAIAAPDEKVAKLPIINYDPIVKIILLGSNVLVFIPVTPYIPPEHLDKY